MRPDSEGIMFLITWIRRLELSNKYYFKGKISGLSMTLRAKVFGISWTEYLRQILFERQNFNFDFGGKMLAIT